MPAPLVAIGIGAGLGLVGGYVWDRVLGDSDYTAREAVVDAAGGAIGGSLAKPLLKGGGKLVKGLHRYRRGGGAISDISGREFAEVGTFIIGRELFTKPVIKGQVKGAVAAHVAGYAYDAIKSRSSPQSYQQDGGLGKQVFETGYALVGLGLMARRVSQNKKKRKPCPPGHVWSDWLGRCVKKRYSPSERDFLTGNPPTRFSAGRRT